MLNPHDHLIMAQTDGGTRIGTAKDHILSLRKRGATLLAWFMRQAAGRGYKISPMLGRVVYAQVNHGHWLVVCPVCNGAEEASPSEPVFYCLSCGNYKDEGRVSRVAFPANREQIEAILLKRPIANRNWHPGESADALAQENIARGYGG